MEENETVNQTPPLVLRVVAILMVAWGATTAVLLWSFPPPETNEFQLVVRAAVGCLGVLLSGGGVHLLWQVQTKKRRGP